MGSFSDFLADPFDFLAGWLQGHLLLPTLWHLGLSAWEDVSYGWALVALYGVAQVGITLALSMPAERLRPLERWAKAESVGTDIFYTLLNRIGLLPLVSFVLFYAVQTWMNGFLTDRGIVPPTIERALPFLLGHPIVTLLVYLVILDFAEYWRHRLSHRFYWWYALHSLHHAQRQMTFWSDDRNHLLDDFVSAIWFGIVALLIGVPPLQFPMLVLTVRILESFSHANTRVHFGWLGERLLISPRFHRAHHSIKAAGMRSCNYGATLPWWDMLFRTADFGREYIRTGDPSAEEALHTGSYVQQQAAGLRRLMKALRPRRSDKAARA
jgi:sterol desaturase/sphingolipid hydroxylase (fatty acid hydroxylase superfamily)